MAKCIVWTATIVALSLIALNNAKSAPGSPETIYATESSPSFVITEWQNHGPETFWSHQLNNLDKYSCATEIQEFLTSLQNDPIYQATHSQEYIEVSENHKVDLASWPPVKKEVHQTPHWLSNRLTAVYDHTAMTGRKIKLLTLELLIYKEQTPGHPFSEQTDVLVLDVPNIQSCKGGLENLHRRYEEQVPQQMDEIYGSQFRAIFSTNQDY